jgi:N-acetylglutamate synthase-like GNAT family acetyltransferase
VDIEIRRAQPDDAETLTSIAHAAKRHWGYPESWIAHWRTELTITPEFISTNEVFVALTGKEIIGCTALVLSEQLAEVEHMWIKPDYIGQGVGRALLAHVRRRAADLRLDELEISSDPNAEGFYRRMGAVRIGEVHSEIEGRSRILPRMKLQL